MRPDDAREVVHHLHVALRVRMRSALDLARRRRRGEIDAVEPLIASARDLCVALQRHGEVEEALIAPVLVQLDAWGDARCEHLVAAHDREASVAAEAGAVLAAARSGGATADEALLAEAVVRLVRESLRAVRREEAALAGVRLAGDCVVCDQMGG